MKKLLLIIIIVLIATGCFGNNKYDIDICSQISDQSASGYNVSTNYEIYSENGIVDKVVISDVVNSKDKNLLNFFKLQYENQYRNLNDKYGGYTYKVKIKNNKVISDVTINYKKFNMKSFVKDNKAMEVYINDDKRITLEGIKKMYSNIGASCNQSEKKA